MDSTRTSEETFELYEQRVQRVIEHVRNHLHEAHDPKSLARLAHFSPYHFQRVFRAVTGESLAGFVRRLRLDEAARQLRQTDAQVIRIALNAGYETHESFTRAFKVRFVVTPSEFREKGGPEF